MKRMLRSCALAAGIALAVAAQSASAATVEFFPEHDAWSLPGNAVPNNSASEFLRVAKDGSPTWAFLKFDLTNTGIPVGSTINSATLTLFMTKEPEETQKQCTGTGQARVCNDVVVAVERTHTLYTSTNAAWNYDTTNLQDNVPASNSVATQTTAPGARTWESGALKTAVTNALGGRISFVVRDIGDGNGFVGEYASKENLLDDDADEEPNPNPDAFKPLLIIDYTPPAECAEGSIHLTKAVYVGINPIEPNDSTTWDTPYEITLTVKAGCKALEGVKVQGGIASNVIIDGFDEPSNGTIATRFVGRGNQIVTWTIPSMEAGAEETLVGTVTVNYNHRDMKVCGAKNLTGDWSATGIWDDEGTWTRADAEVGKFVVDVSCSSE